MVVEKEWLEMFIDLQLIGGTLLAMYLFIFGEKKDGDDD